MVVLGQYTNLTIFGGGVVYMTSFNVKNRTCVGGGGRERHGGREREEGRERERQRQRNTETDRQTDRQTDRETEKKDVCWHCPSSGLRLCFEGQVD